MAIIYSDTPKLRKFRGSKIHISEWECSRVMASWLIHAENRAVLDFYIRNGSLPEKMQAIHEMKICERKLAYWERHQNFSGTEQAKLTAYIHRQWRNPISHRKLEDSPAITIKPTSKYGLVKKKK